MDKPIDVCVLFGPEFIFKRPVLFVGMGGVKTINVPSRLLFYLHKEHATLIGSTFPGSASQALK